MATNIFLGYPPENIKQFIIENYGSAITFKNLTQIFYTEESGLDPWEGNFSELYDEFGEEIPNANYIEKIIFGLEDYLPAGSIIYNFENLKEVYIPETWYDIPHTTFSECPKLVKVEIPDSISYIDIGCFYQCADELYDKITIPGALLVDGWLVNHDGTLKVLDVTKCRGIAHESLFHCWSLNSCPNSTCEEIVAMIESYFGAPENETYDGPAEMTITCKDGIVHATGIWNEDESYAEGWNIEILPL